MGVRVFTLAVALALVGCADGHCRRKVEPPAEAQPLEATPPAPAQADRLRPKDHVLVYKYDGGAQCEPKRAISPEQMAKELKDIPIVSMEKRSDGLIHISSCGGSTGVANVYEISAKHLPRAEAKGFRRWTFERP